MSYDEIKKVFLKYDGSMFALAREEIEKYEIIKTLNISDEILEKWRQEKFLYLWKQLKESGSAELFNRMYNLSEQSHTRDNLMILRDALYYINYAEPKINAYICETVLGRKELVVRSGMIFWAYDIGEIAIAKELEQFVLKLVNVETSDDKIRVRLDEIVQKCNLISSMIVRTD